MRIAGITASMNITENDPVSHPPPELPTVATGIGVISPLDGGVGSTSPLSTGAGTISPLSTGAGSTSPLSVGEGVIDAPAYTALITSRPETPRLSNGVIS